MYSTGKNDKTSTKQPHKQASLDILIKRICLLGSNHNIAESPFKRKTVKCNSINTLYT